MEITENDRRGKANEPHLPDLATRRCSLCVLCALCGCPFVRGWVG